MTIDLLAVNPGVTEASIQKSEIDDARLRASAQAPDVVVRVLRGHRMRDTRAVFEEFDAVFQLPSYFGKNWAALDECMNDQDWFPASLRVILVFMESKQIFAAESHREEAVQTLRKFCQRLSADWGNGANGRTTEVCVLFQS